MGVTDLYAPTRSEKKSRHIRNWISKRMKYTPSNMYDEGQAKLLGIREELLEEWYSYVIELLVCTNKYS
jgi:hypothetical protein